jgi:hypothetical protein
MIKRNLRVAGITDRFDSLNNDVTELMRKHYTYHIPLDEIDFENLESHIISIISIELPTIYDGTYDGLFNDNLEETKDCIISDIEKNDILKNFPNFEFFCVKLVQWINPNTFEPSTKFTLYVKYNKIDATLIKLTT